MKNRIELIITGEELFDGRVQDTNSYDICSTLYSKGFKVTKVNIIGDDPEILFNTFKEIIQRSEIIIITGGLGPTQDDLTFEILAKVLEVPLVRNQELVQLLEECYRKRCIPIPETNYKQADIPNGSIIIKNKIGTAAGIRIKKDSGYIFALPGIPDEMNSMLKNHIIPFLSKKYIDNLQQVNTKIYKCFGVSESKIAEELINFYPLPKDFSLGFQVQYPEVHVVLSNYNLENKSKFQELEKKIISKIGDYVFGVNNETFIQYIGNYLRKNNLTLAVAESCTGGLMSYLLTKEPGASDFLGLSMVTYSNLSKATNLGVDSKIIEKYGAVSYEVATSMAERIRAISKADIGISVTGIAGPTGAAKDKPLGTVFIAKADKYGIKCKRYHFFGVRHKIQLQTAYQALSQICR